MIPSLTTLFQRVPKMIRKKQMNKKVKRKAVRKEMLLMKELTLNSRVTTLTNFLRICIVN